MSSTSTDRFKADPTSSNRAGVTLMNNQVGYVVANVMRGKPGVTVEELPSMIRVDGDNKFEIDYASCAEALGCDDFGNDAFERSCRPITVAWWFSTTASSCSPIPRTQRSTLASTFKR